MPKAATIFELVAENVKKIRVVEIQAQGRKMVQITGKNGAGKSTILDCIWFALQGQKVLPDRKDSWVRNGQKRAQVKLKLGGGELETFTITRTIGTTGNPPTLTIEPQIHKKYDKTPQRFLDDLFGALTFDPLAFAQMTTAEKVEELKRAAKVDLDFDALAQADDEDYKARHLINQKVVDLDARLKGMGTFEGLPKQKVDTAALSKQLEDAAEANKKAQAKFAERQQIGAHAAQLGYEKQRKADEYEAQEERIRDLKRQLDQAKIKLSELHDELNVLTTQHSAAEKEYRAADPGAPVDVVELSRQLQAAERTNHAIDRRAEYDQVKADKETKQRESDLLTRRMEQRAEQKRSAMANAKIPVPGLTFDEREVKYKGVPIENLGEGEQIRISTLIGMAANPKLRIICIRHGEALDDDGIQQIAELAKQNDFQVWMARVDTSGKVGIVLEDGSVAARNEEE